MAVPDEPSPSPAQHRPRIQPSLWLGVAAEARQVGLRTVATQHGVCHEAVRQIVRRVASEPLTSYATWSGSSAGP